MSVIIIDGDQSVKLSHLSLSQLNRMQMEHRILSCFFDRRKLTIKELVERTGLPRSSIRNHLDRMVRDGSLKHTKTNVENYRLSWYEVV